MATRSRLTQLFQNYRLAFVSLSYLILIAIVYWRVTDFGFIWDDYTYIVNNDVLTSPHGLLQIWTTHSTADFWPLSYSLFWLQKQLYGNTAIGFHAANLALFFLSCVLIYTLLKKLKIKSAFFLTAIYAVHPMNVEAAVWVFQAKTNLANVFGLLSMIYWLNFVQKNKSYFFYTLSFIFLLLSFLAKISLVMLPVIMLLYLLLNDNSMSLLKKIIVTVPFFVSTLILGLINLHWDANAYIVPPSEMILEPNYLFRFALVGKTFLFYLIKTFWPHPLMFAHPRWFLNVDNFTTFLPSALLTLFLIYSIFGIFKKRNHNSILVGFLISFLILFPALGITEIYFMRFSFVAEHWLTLGMIGFLLFFVEYLIKIKNGKPMLVLLILLYGIISYNYVGDYSSEKKLLESSLEKNPTSILPHNILGLTYKSEGNLEKALYHFKKSIEIQPNAQSYFNIASINEMQGQIEMAKQNYLKAIELNPYIPKTYNSLGALYAKNNDFPNALDNFNKALLRDPGDSTIYYNIGLTYEFMNQKSTALDWIKKANLLQPNNDIYLRAIQRLNK